jgi:hypothetical protein
MEYQLKVAADTLSFGGDVNSIFNAFADEREQRERRMFYPPVEQA